jgi:hypothetical protein
MIAGRPGVIVGALVAAAISFGALAMGLSPLRWLGWALPISSFVASAIWLALVVIAFKRFGKGGAWALLGAPLALASPLLFFSLGLLCDWGRGPCM